jgi:DNA repair protein RadA/Sms
MAKASKNQFVCQSCGAVSTRWAGKCVGCNEWNTISEEAGSVAAVPGSGLSGSTRGRAVKLETLAARSEEVPRIWTGMAELDRVTGGGIVPGSAMLIGGEPGIGKSTLLLQLTAALASQGHSTIYFSGEEAAAQVRMRAERLGLSNAPVKLASETNLANILATLSEGRRPDLVVIDSIQTLWADALDAAPGTVSQVRAATQSLIRFAKQAGSALLLVGHVTKDGQIAGPKVVEHMVDTVLYFEGDRGHPFRILRAVKNRFGATDEIGVFEMVQSGLREVANPSELFLGDRDSKAPGAAVFAGVEGTAAAG